MTGYGKSGKRYEEEEAVHGFLIRPDTRKHYETGANANGNFTFSAAGMRGWREFMEDAHFAHPNFNVEKEHGLFGVFDGHGGWAVAQVVAKRFPETFKNCAAYKAGRYPEALKETFLNVDRYLASQTGRSEVKKLSGGEGPDFMGCTAVVTFVQGGPRPEIFVANAGDSRCVLIEGKSAVDMSTDHTPFLPSERKRIAMAGGHVTREGRVNGNLNLSRSLGDLFYKRNQAIPLEDQMISPEPEIRHRVLKPRDRFLIIGCDGIWERRTSQGVTNFLLDKIEKSETQIGKPTNPRMKWQQMANACGDFLDVNVAKDPELTDGLGCDNMSVLLVDLNVILQKPKPIAVATALRPVPLLSTAKPQQPKSNLQHKSNLQWTQPSVTGFQGKRMPTSASGRAKHQLPQAFAPAKTTRPRNYENDKERIQQGVPYKLKVESGSRRLKTRDLSKPSDSTRFATRGFGLVASLKSMSGSSRRSPKSGISERANSRMTSVYKGSSENETGK